MRGTLLMAARTQLRLSGLFEAYDRGLTAEARQQLEGVMAGTWTPIALAHAHFAAVDALELSEAAILENQRAGATKLHEVFLSTAFRLVRESGLTPWTGMPALAKVWERMFDGGAVGVQQVGPKDARLHIVAHPLLRYRYHRIGMRAHAEKVLGLCTVRVFVHEVAREASADALTLLARWV